LSKESIERNINGKQDTSEMHTVEFECYGPNGIQIIVNALTDNTNRVISSLNGFLAKLDGKIAKPNSVKSFFDNSGYILISKKDLTMDGIMELTMPYEVIDINEDDNVFEIVVSPKDFGNLKNMLNENKIEIQEAEIKLIPQNYVSDISTDVKQKLEKFIDSCMNDDDIQ
jgi:YebC/PmpR family DNA-binding regulatory protein